MCRGDVFVLQALRRLRLTARKGACWGVGKLESKVLWVLGHVPG